jgi:hypothetical protein
MPVLMDILRAVQIFFISLLVNIIRSHYSLVTFMFLKSTSNDVTSTGFVLYIYCLSKSLQYDWNRYNGNDVNVTLCLR